MKDYLSISELAKLRNITTETLRHYDRIGLFQPEYVDPLTSRRYYSSDQFEILGTIRELRQLGMSLADIKDYFDDRNLDKSAEILARRYELLKREIEEKRLLERTLRRKLQFIKEIRRITPDFEPHLKQFDERKMVCFNKMYTDGRQLTYSMTELERYLLQKAPVLASDRMGFFTSVNIFEGSFSREYPIAPMILCSDTEAERISAQVKTIPAGSYACIYYHGTARIPETQFELMKEFLQANGLVICGNIYIQYIIDVTLTSRLDEKLIEMQIPISALK